MRRRRSIAFVHALRACATGTAGRRDVPIYNETIYFYVHGSRGCVPREKV